MMVDRRHLKNTLSVCCLEISYLNHNGKYFHKVDQSHDQDKQRHLHHISRTCHKTARAREPVSPINTFAGYTLNRRNPISAPYNCTCDRLIPAFIPMETTVKNTATIRVTLEARPSSPSVKLTPFTVPITAKKRPELPAIPIQKMSAPEWDSHSQEYLYT